MAGVDQDGLGVGTSALGVENRCTLRKKSGLWERSTINSVSDVQAVTKDLTAPTAPTTMTMSTARTAMVNCSDQKDTALQLEPPDSPWTQGTLTK